MRGTTVVLSLGPPRWSGTNSSDYPALDYRGDAGPGDGWSPLSLKNRVIYTTLDCL